MPLKLHNTLTKKTEEFQPQADNLVRLYTCGPTVYNYQHVGNWFGYIMWDVLIRVLQANHYNVTRIINITDVGHLTSDEDEGEDKLEKGARREGKTAWEIAEFYTNDFLEGMKKLNLLPPAHIARATDYIPEQLALMRTLKEKGYTYQTSDGIYFDTSKFPTYAEFAELDLAGMRAGARVEFNPEKRNPSDFALWKFTPAGETRHMEWETPAYLLGGAAIGQGQEAKNPAAPIMGFPGWHLECSAIAMKFLGDTLDIHTGGIDHIPVHHTNEIAQSESATSKLFSRFWLHNNHLKSEGTKISKSLGNGYTLQDLEVHGLTAIDYRMFALQSHYRNESNFTWENLTAAKNRLHHWRNVAALRHQTHDTLESDEAKGDDDKTVQLYAASHAMLEALNDDLNTPAALAIVDDAFSRLDSAGVNDIHQRSLMYLLQAIDDLLGLNLLKTTPDITDEQKQLVLKRNHVREAKGWAASDSIRDELLAQGIAIRDTPRGSIWEYA